MNGAAVPQIVALSGYAGSGKDSAARLLAPWGYQRAAIADGLRRTALVVDPWLPPHRMLPAQRLSAYVQQVGWETAKRHRPEVRAVLQRLGQGIEQEDPGAVVRAFLKRLPDGPVVVTDTRRLAELDVLRRMGAVTVRLDRPGRGPGSPHPVERELDGASFDHRIANDGGLGTLGQRLAAALGLPPL